MLFIRLILISSLFIVSGCSSDYEKSVVQEEIKIEHKFYNIGDLVEDFSFNYTVNSVKIQEDIPAKDGHVWLVFDITFKDNQGNKYNLSDYASIYGDFILLDDEGYFYRGYLREKKTEFYGSARDYVLFMVPASKKEFLLFDDFFWDDGSKLDDESRNIVKINLNNN